MCGGLLWILTPLDSGELLIHLRTLDEGVEHVENAVAAPRLGVLAQDLDLVVILPLLCYLLAVGAEAVELIDELVDDIPSPIVLYEESQMDSPSPPAARKEGRGNKTLHSQ